MKASQRPSGRWCASCRYRDDSPGHRIACLGLAGIPASQLRRAWFKALVVGLVSWMWPSRNQIVTASAARSGGWRLAVAQAGRHAALHVKTAEGSVAAAVAGAGSVTAAGATAAVLLAAPAVAGVAQQHQAAPPGPARPVLTAVVRTAPAAARAPAAAQSGRHRRPVVVRPGDSLSAIGARHGLSWQVLWEANRRHIANPNLIFPGQVLAVPGRREVVRLAARYLAHPWAHPWAQPARLARSWKASGTDGDGDYDHDHSDGGASHGQRYAAPRHAAAPAVSLSSGVFSCAGLESLWDQAGGPSGVARLMAGIAMAESGGNARAYNPSGASGLWQILGLPFAGDPFNPATNAAMAVSKYRSQGLGAWVTYTSGAYGGRC